MTEALCYVAIGDSSTAGTGETFVRWTDLLTTALRAGGLDFTCHNLAVYGVKCTEVAETQLEPALELNPDLLSVLCGINDVLMSPAPDIERYECVLDGM